jgi:lysozyme family protein
MFDKAIQFILNQEGGYVCNINDPGGETNFGISKRAYPNVDIKNLTIEQAVAIYKFDYWNKCKCDEMPFNLALAVLDSAVNQGVNAACKMLQQACKVNVDGIIGQQTLKAINKNTFVDFMSLRAIRYTKSNVFDKYGFGWYRRLFNLTEFLK